MQPVRGPAVPLTSPKPQVSFRWFWAAAAIVSAVHVPSPGLAAEVRENVAQSRARGAAPVERSGQERRSGVGARESPVTLSVTALTLEPVAAVRLFPPGLAAPVEPVSFARAGDGKTQTSEPLQRQASRQGLRGLFSFSSFQLSL